MSIVQSYQKKENKKKAEDELEPPKTLEKMVEYLQPRPEIFKQPSTRYTTEL